MADSKLEEIIDLLAVYGGFNREYLRDKLLTGRSKHKNKSKTENKNKMEAIAKLFGKKLDEEFIISVRQAKYVALFSYDGLEIFDTYCDCWMIDYEILWGLLTGKVMIVNE